MEASRLMGLDYHTKPLSHVLTNFIWKALPSVGQIPSYNHSLHRWLYIKLDTTQTWPHRMGLLENMYPLKRYASVSD